jgi:hypothetical protein
LGYDGFEHNIGKPLAEGGEAQQIDEIEGRTYILAKAGKVDAVEQTGRANLAFQPLPLRPFAHDVAPEPHLLFTKDRQRLEEDRVTFGDGEAPDHTHHEVLIVPPKVGTTYLCSGWRPGNRESAPDELDLGLWAEDGPQVPGDPLADRHETRSPRQVSSQNLLVGAAFETGVLESILAVHGRDSTRQTLSPGREEPPQLRLHVVCVDDTVPMRSNQITHGPNDPRIVTLVPEWMDRNPGRHRPAMKRCVFQGDDRALDAICQQ